MFVAVIGVILLCLFPLWPQSVRKGVYYLSIAAAGFLFFIIALAVFRLLAFCVVWVLTLGRHHLWILPNLTEDVGFFESFWPLYKYEYRGKASEEKSEKNEKSEKEAEAKDAKEEAADTKRKEKSKKKWTDVKSSTADTDHNSEDNEFEVLDASEAHEDESEDEDDEDS